MKIFSVICFVLTGFVSVAQDSLTIEQAIQLALKHNYGVLISRNLADIGKINNNWVSAGAYPTISATANKTLGVSNIRQELNSGSTIVKNGATNQNLNAGLNINWRVFDGFKMFATKKRLEELERNGEYVFKKNIDELVYNVVSQYYNIVKLREVLKATSEQIQLYQDRLKIATMKYNIGSGAKFEMLQPEVDLNEQRSNQLNLQNAIQLAKLSLDNLMGSAADTSYKVADTIIINPIPDILTIESKIQSSNPDVLIANSNLAILLQSKREINSGKYPSVILNGNYNFIKSSNGAGLTLSNQNFGPSASVGVSVPLFNGGVVKRQLQVADIGIKNQNLTIAQLKETIHTSVISAVSNYNNSLNLIAFERANLALASENVMIARERFKLLNITSVELRQVQNSYIDAQNRLFNALYQAKLAEAEIELLMGTEP